LAILKTYSIVLHKEVGKKRLSHSDGRGCLLPSENLFHFIFAVLAEIDT
jgi:hypothetical protein